MCIAIAQKQGAPLLEKKIFQTCFDRNKDGIGMAWIDWNAKPSRRIRVVRFGRNAAGKFDLNHAWDYYRRIHNHFGKKTPILIHFRWSTHGVIHPSNSHPFKILPKLAMIHNGVLPMPTEKCGIKNLFDYNQVVEHFSDTWHYAKLYFPKFSYLTFHSKGFRKDTEKFIGKSNKLCFLDANAYSETIKNTYKTSPLIIYNEGEGNWHNDTWFSNMNWKPYEAPVYGRPCAFDNCNGRVYRDQDQYCWQCESELRDLERAAKRACCGGTSHSDTKFYSGGYNSNKSKSSNVKVCKSNGCNTLIPLDSINDWCAECDSKSWKHRKGAEKGAGECQK